MLEQLKYIIDTRMSHAILFAFGYIYYFFHVLNGLEFLNSFIFPNSFILLYIWITGIYCSSAMQEIEHNEMTNREMQSFFFLSFFPVLLVIKYLMRFRSQEIDRDNDIFFIWGLNLIIGTLGLISLIILAISLYTLVFLFRFQILLLFILFHIGMWGYLLGLWINQLREETPSVIQNLQIQLIKPLVTDRTRRVGVFILLTILFIILYIIDSLVSFSPITV